MCFEMNGITSCIATNSLALIFQMKDFNMEAWF